jgi:hypothetical protein
MTEYAMLIRNVALGERKQGSVGQGIAGHTFQT